MGPAQAGLVAALVNRGVQQSLTYPNAVFGVGAPKTNIIDSRGWTP